MQTLNKSVPDNSGAWKVQVSMSEKRERHLHVWNVWKSSKEASGSEARTCIHCRTRQCVEDGDESMYSSGNTQTPSKHVKQSPGPKTLIHVHETVKRRIFMNLNQKEDKYNPRREIRSRRLQP